MKYLISEARKIFEGNLWLRKILARPITKIKRSERAKVVFKSMGFAYDPWKENKKDEFRELREKYTVDFKSMLNKPFDGVVAFISEKDDPLCVQFEKVCRLLGCRPVIIDGRSSRFLEEASGSGALFFLVRPSHSTLQEREMYREKVDALVNGLRINVCPSVVELDFYESKRRLAYFLKVNKIPHPETSVFFSVEEAFNFLETCSYPQVFKTTSGASATGVEIFRSEREAKKFIKNIFDTYYLPKNVIDYRDLSYGYAILQKYIPNAREYRVIKLGDSWFGHEKDKLDTQEFMSGSGISKWTPPPDHVLNFCSVIADKHEFNSMCFDVFEDESGDLYINELQTWFGSYNPSQMYIGDTPGRYLYDNFSGWRFEVGLFNDFNSMALRLVSALNLYNWK